MIFPDANLCCTPTTRRAPFHARAVASWQECLSGMEPVGLMAPVLFSFVKIGTGSGAFVRPMSVNAAAGHVRKWLERPVVSLVEMCREDVERALDSLCRAGAGGNLTTDAQLAAVAIRRRAVVHNSDSDFGRFPDVA